MPKPRYAQIALGETPYVHVVSRVVRQAYLCGKDEHNKKSYNHRRKWIEDEILRLSEVFALEISAYSVMSNHYHIVLHVNLKMARSWSYDEVIERWHRLFKGSLQSQQYMAGEVLNESHQQLLMKQVKEWRCRLSNVSWFMRMLKRMQGVKT